MRWLGIGSIWTGANRLGRRCGFDRNELRRSVDRRQRSIAIGLVLLYLVAAPVAVLRAAAIAYDRGIQAERYEAATRHKVTATVVALGSPGTTGRAGTWATWTEPDGRRRTDTIVVWRGKADQGETQQIWVDASDRPTIRPRWRSQTIADVSVAALVASIGVAVPLLVIYTVVRRLGDRRRNRDWDLAWALLDRRHAG